MEGLQAIRRSIESAENLKTVVGTMKAHASSNINQFQNAAKASMEYRSVLDMSLYVVLTSDEPMVLQDDSDTGGVLHVVFGSDFGLAGRFNERIASFALEKIVQNPGDMIIIIGQQILSRIQDDFSIHRTFMQPQTTDNISSMVNRLLVEIDDLRAASSIGRIVLYYNKPLDNASFAEETELLFPVDLMALTQPEMEWDSRSIPTYFGEKQDIISDLVRQYFFITLYRAFCFSLASENASRLASMQSAEKNIDNRLEELYDLFRRERQNRITEELNDIVSGFKAIRKSKDKNQNGSAS